MPLFGKWAFESFDPRAVGAWRIGGGALVLGGLAFLLVRALRHLVVARLVGRATFNMLDRPELLEDRALLLYLQGLPLRRWTPGATARVLLIGAALVPGSCVLIMPAPEIPTTGAPTLLAEEQPVGTGTVSQLGLSLEVTWDERDVAGTPTAGYTIEGGASYFPGMADLEESFGFVHGEVATYLSPGGGNPTLALRAGGKKVWGGFPYYEAAFLGGAKTLRGLQEERFAGDAMIYGSVELRAFLARLTFMLPIDIGVFALGDIGRVYLDGEASSEWHTGRGVGIWIAPLSRSSTVRLSIAQSEGRTAFYAGMEFAY